MMSFTRVALVLLATALLADTTSRAAEEDLAVIVNKSNPISALTMTQLRKMVLAQETKWPGGGRIAVWMAKPGQPDRVATLKLLCRMTETDFTLYFMHASFNGDTGQPPQAAPSGASVRQAVAKAAYGLGVVWLSQANDTVKILSIDGSLPGQPAYKLRPKP
jgi:ABC-type phosphate transport system substrate-binding protein